MKCPKCESLNVRVKDSRPTEGNGITRTRICLDCGARFRSIEYITEIQTDESRKYTEI